MISGLIHGPASHAAVGEVGGVAQQRGAEAAVGGEAPRVVGRGAGDFLDGVAERLEVVVRCDQTLGVGVGEQRQQLAGARLRACRGGPQRLHAGGAVERGHQRFDVGVGVAGRGVEEGAERGEAAVVVARAEACRCRYLGGGGEGAGGEYGAQGERCVQGANCLHFRLIFASRKNRLQGWTFVPDSLPCRPRFAAGECGGWGSGSLTRVTDTGPRP